MGRLRKRTGLRFDLPTEAQWEYAFCAGTKLERRWSGVLSELDPAFGVAGKDSPNAWGLYDMESRVWCLDVWDREEPCGDDPVGPSFGAYDFWCRNASDDWYYYVCNKNEGNDPEYRAYLRVICGGFWGFSYTFRTFKSADDSTSGYVGFRVCL